MAPLDCLVETGDRFEFECLGVNDHMANPLSVPCISHMNESVPCLNHRRVRKLALWRLFDEGCRPPVLAVFTHSEMELISLAPSVFLFASVDVVIEQELATIC